MYVNPSIRPIRPFPGPTYQECIGSRYNRTYFLLYFGGGGFVISLPNRPGLLPLPLPYFTLVMRFNR